MKKTLFLLFIFVFINSCSTQKIAPDKTVVKEIETPSTGWIDNDTYTVKVISSNLDSAIDLAKHRILQDIVKVRMMNESKYTDITKISQEFENPLKKGKVIRKRSISGEVEIYYQVRDKNLRRKFER